MSITLFKALCILLLVLVLISLFMINKSKWPVWALEPCTRCEGSVQWLKGQDSDSTAEAKFECTDCKQQQFRGGWGSELVMEHHENK